MARSHLRGENWCGPTGRHLVEKPSRILWEELAWLSCEDEEEKGRAQSVQVVPGASGTLPGKTAGFTQLCL